LCREKKKKNNQRLARPNRVGFDGLASRFSYKHKKENLFILGNRFVYWTIEGSSPFG
jgi:hypothetical protein